jgi:hypothetical protein
MKRTDAFPGNYLKAQHCIDGGDMLLTITGVTMEAIGDDKREKPVVSFKEDERGLVLNATNWDTIADAYGDDSDDWTGKTVQLYATKTSFGSKRVDCIRVRVPEFNDPIPDLVDEAESSAESAEAY